MEPTLTLVQILIWRTERSASSTQSQYFTNFTHCNPLGRHKALPGKGRAYQRILNQCVKDDSGECEQCSGMLNTVSGKEGEVFRLNRNERSHWSGNGVYVESGIGVHDRPWNMHSASRHRSVSSPASYLFYLADVVIWRPDTTVCRFSSRALSSPRMSFTRRDEVKIGWLCRCSSLYQAINPVPFRAASRLAKPL